MAIATTAEKNALAVEYGIDAAYAALFTADPGTTGTVVGEATGGSPAYARKAITWSAPTNGVITATVTFDVPAGTYTYAAVTTSLTGANLIDKLAITSTTFPGQGTLQVNLSYTQV